MQKILLVIVLAIISLLADWQFSGLSQAAESYFSRVVYHTEQKRAFEAECLRYGGIVDRSERNLWFCLKRGPEDNGHCMERLGWSL